MFNLRAHTNNIVKIHEGESRKWDKEVPYWTHPMWCAIMIMSEPLLSKEQRHRGALALLYHDSIESGSGAPASVFNLVKGMTFEDFNAEMRLLMSQPDEVILLKLYDKTSNLLDGHWMSKEKRDDYRLHTLRLIEHVKEVYGDLQICKFAKVLIQDEKPKSAECLHKNQTVFWSGYEHDADCNDCGERL